MDLGHFVSWCWFICLIILISDSWVLILGHFVSLMFIDVNVTCSCIYLSDHPWYPTLGSLFKSSMVPIWLKNGPLFSPNFKLQKSFLDSALGRKCLGSQEPFWCRFANMIHGQIKSCFPGLWRSEASQMDFSANKFIWLASEKILMEMPSQKQKLCVCVDGGWKTSSPLNFLCSCGSAALKGMHFHPFLGGCQ